MLFWTSSFTQEERYVSAGEYTANQSFAAVEKWSAWGSRLWSLNSLDALSFSAGALWVACRSKILDGDLPLAGRIKLCVERLLDVDNVLQFLMPLLSRDGHGHLGDL